MNHNVLNSYGKFESNRRGKLGLDLSISKVIILSPKGSTTPNSNNKSLHCVRQFWRTSKYDMAIGDGININYVVIMGRMCMRVMGSSM
jgi:hypothetical protein